MTNLNKFAAQQLTKKQMNEVTGGALWTCVVEGQMIDARFIADTKADAEAQVKSLYGSGDCTKVK